jgi:hypothetical protein
MCGKLPGKPAKDTVRSAGPTAKPVKKREITADFVGSSSVRQEISIRVVVKLESATFCYTWVILLHFPLTTNCP